MSPKTIETISRDRDLSLSNESCLAARHSLFVTCDLACLTIRDPQVKSASHIKFFKSEAMTGGLTNYDPRLVIRDLGGHKSQVMSGE